MSKKKNSKEPTIPVDVTPNAFYYFSESDRIEMTILRALATKKMDPGELLNFCTEAIAVSPTTFYKYRDALIDKGYIGSGIDHDESTPKKRAKFMLTYAGLEYTLTKNAIIRMINLAQLEEDGVVFHGGGGPNLEPRLMGYTMAFGRENRVKYGELLNYEGKIEPDPKLMQLCAFFVARVLNYALEKNPIPDPDDWQGILKVLKNWQSVVEAQQQKDAHAS